MSVHLTLDNDPVQYLCAIDARKIGVEVYKQGSFRHAVARCFHWDYSFPESNVFFKKHSLQEFLSKNLGKLVDVDALSYEEIVEKIKEIAKKAAQQPDNFTEQQVSYVVRTVKQPNPDETEIVVQLNDYPGQAQPQKKTPRLLTESPVDENTEGEQLNRNRFLSIEPSPSETFSKDVTEEPSSTETLETPFEENPLDFTFTEPSKDVFIGIPYKEPGFCPDFSLNTPPSSPQKEQKEQVTGEEYTQNNGSDDTKLAEDQPSLKTLDLDENPLDIASTKPPEEILIGVPLSEETLSPQEKVTIEEQAPNNSSDDTKLEEEPASFETLDLNKPVPIKELSSMESAEEIPPTTVKLPKDFSADGSYGEITPLFPDISLETPPVSPQKVQVKKEAAPKEKVKVKLEPIQNTSSGNTKVEVKKEVKGTYLTPAFERLNTPKDTKLPIARLRVFNQTHSALIKQLLNSEIADRQEASRVFLGKIMGVERAVSTKGWKRTTDHLVSSFELQCEKRSHADQALFDIFKKIVAMTK